MDTVSGIAWAAQGGRFFSPMERRVEAATTHGRIDTGAVVEMADSAHDGSAATADEDAELVLWVSPVWRTFPTSGGGTELADRSGVDRPYEYWDHAVALHRLAARPLAQGDVINALKKAADHRVRRLKDLYPLKALTESQLLPKGLLDRLEVLGVVRPLMLHRLMTLRNAMEHQFTDPPDAQTCADLIDLVWYFLRSTDILVAQVRTEIEYDAGDRHTDRPVAEVSYLPESGHLSLIGILPTEEINSGPRPGWLEVRLWRPPHLTADRSLTYLSGDVVSPAAELMTEWRRYFVDVYLH